MKNELLEYGSFGKFLDHSINGKSSADNSHRSSRIISDKKTKFTETKTFEAAIDMARSGWIDQADKIRKQFQPIFNGISQLIEKTEINYDVTGHAIDIGRYVEGIPEQWMTFDSVISEGSGHKIIKIVGNIAANWMTKSLAFTNKGALIVALSELLEYAGHRTEIYAVESVNYDGGIDHIVTVKIKSADQPLDLPKLAYVFCHPSMLRRLVFSVQECLKDVQDIIGGGYGRPVNRMQKFGDVYVPITTPDMAEWSQEYMMDYIKKELQKCGVTINLVK